MKLEQIQRARQDLARYIKKTPLQRCQQLEEKLQTKFQIYLKREDQQFTSSYKVRGAFNAILNLTPEQKAKGVVTRSSGNFAQAVAYAAKTLGVKAVIVMPENAPRIKVEGTASHHPEIIFCGNTHQEGQAKVVELASERGLTVLSPYDNLNVIAGQGTIALEVLEEVPQLATFYGPIGGGGIMGGCTAAIKQLNSAITTVGVEPSNAADYFVSRKLGARTLLTNSNTIADGLMAPQVGEHNWPLLQQYVDEVELVTEFEIKSAMRWAKEQLLIRLEPSGAAALAALLYHPHRYEGDIVCVLTGANVDPNSYDRWLAEASH